MPSARPEISGKQATQLAASHFGLSCTAEELPGYSDRNFQLTTAAGARYVLKIAPEGVEQAAIEGQMAALRHLEGTPLSQIVPRPVADSGGGMIASVSDEKGDPAIARMYTYLPGVPIALLDRRTAGLRRQIGRSLGALDNALDSFDHPGMHRSHSWDLQRTLGLRPFLKLVEPDLQPLVEAGLSAFESYVVPHLDGLRRSVVHNDANDYNLLARVAADGSQHLTGLIDFGDTIHTITVAELAIACAYAMLDEKEPHAAAADVASGYEESMPLSDLEGEILPVLVVSRLCASLLHTSHASALEPDNEYLEISRRPVIDLLRKLA